MKKTMKLFWLLAAAAVAFSCSKETNIENIDPDNSSEEPAVVTPVTDGNLLTSFGVTFENDAESKVTVDLGTGATDIKTDDEVLVFVDKENYATYRYDGSKFVLKVGEKAVTLSSTVSVYYPRKEFDIYNDAVVFVMPNGIEASGDFGAINPMAGVIADTSGSYTVELKNLASVLKVQVTADVNIESVTLDYGSMVYYAAGCKFYVDATHSTMSYAKDHQGNTTEKVTITPANTADVLFLIPTVDLASGLSVTANLVANHNGGANTFTVTNPSTNARARNTISTMSFYAGLFSGGEGTSENPYKISNARDFKYIQKYTTEGYNTPGGKDAAHFLSAYYEQTADIDIKNASLTPIGQSGTGARFSGKYNGNSNKLQNVKVDVDTQFASVFGYLDGDAQISNLTISGSVNSSYNGLASVGGIAGILQGNAQITNCTNSATVTAENGQYVGGIVGRVYSNAASISNCHNTAAISGASYIGGISGEVRGGKVNACENRGNVTASAAEAGGIAGRIQGGTINASYSSNNALIVAASRVGGIAGYQSNQGVGASLIINCAAKSQVRSKGNGNNGAAGGLVGYMYSASGKGDVVLTNSVALGNGVANTSLADAYLGAIVGQINGAASLCLVRNCYSQHNSTTNTSAAVYYSNKSDASTITTTKGTYMGGIFGYFQVGQVLDCYCVGNNTNGVLLYNNSSTDSNDSSAKTFVGVGKAGVAPANCRTINNNVKNGTATVDPSGWRICSNNITPTTMTSAYLVDVMNLGTWSTNAMTTRATYTSSQGNETLSEWVGLNETGHVSYDPAVPKAFKDLNFSL